MQRRRRAAPVITSTRRYSSDISLCLGISPSLHRCADLSGRNGGQFTHSGLGYRTPIEYVTTAPPPEPREGSTAALTPTRNRTIPVLSALIRAEGHAQERRRRRKSEGDQCLGRSRSGFSTKLHGLADSLGKPRRFALTAGQAGDAPTALALLGMVAMITVKAVLGDRIVPLGVV